MELVVDLEGGTVTLADPADTARFALAVGAPPSARAGADAARLGAVLAATGVGRLGEAGGEEEGAHAYIAPDAVRRLAAGRVPDGWEEAFGAMVAYADSKGWVDGADGAIRAHVVWPAPSS